MELLLKPTVRRTGALCTAAVLLAVALVLLTGLAGPFSASAAAAEPWSFGVMTDTHW